MHKSSKSALPPPPTPAAEDSSPACKSRNSTDARTAAGRVQGKMHCKRRGEVAEAAFLYKAASLGFSVAKPWGESDRYDFILDNGGRSWRVQVKSAYTSAVNGYTFHACGKVPSRRYTPSDIDFIVGYVVPNDVWYVLPIALFAKIGAIKVFPASRRRMSRYEKYREAWCLMACPNDGVCKAEIDIQHCCQRGSVRDESVCPESRG